jgi:hypothetical protein
MISSIKHHSISAMPRGCLVDRFKLADIGQKYYPQQTEDDGPLKPLYTTYGYDEVLKRTQQNGIDCIYIDTVKLPKHSTRYSLALLLNSHGEKNIGKRRRLRWQS